MDLRDGNSPVHSSGQLPGDKQNKTNKTKTPEGEQSGEKTPLLKVTGFAAREGVSEEQGAELMVEEELKSWTKNPAFSRQKPSGAPRDSSNRQVARYCSEGLKRPGDRRSGPGINGKSKHSQAQHIPRSPV